MIIFRGVSYLYRYCWEHNKIYIILLAIKQIISCIYAIFTLIIPKYVIDKLFIEKNVQQGVGLIILQIAITFLYSYFDVFLNNHILLKRMIVFKDFQLHLGNVVMQADYEKIENPEYLDTRSKAYKYLYGNGSGFGQVLESGFSIVGNMITLLGIPGILVSLNPFFIGVLIIVVFVNAGFDAKFKKKNISLNLEKVQYERRGQYFTNIFSDFRYGKEIRANGIAEWLLNLYNTQLEAMQKFYKKIAHNNIISGLISAIIYVVQQALLYGYIILKVLENTITVGEFTMYLNSVLNFTNTLRNILLEIIDLRQCTDYFEEYEKYISMNNCQMRKGKLKPKIDKENFVIEFRNVYYKYNGQECYALENISVKLKSNNKIAILGENGSGKSTFIKLLLRIYEPTSGEILINGIDITEIDDEYYCQWFASVFQDYKLFSVSLRDNITLGKEKNEKEILSILKKCGLYEKVQELPFGVDTYIHKDYQREGFEPSGGEGQKIALVRALCRNAMIAILGEPAAALDPIAEANIYGQFDEFFNNRLVIYISHRYAVTRFCDNILMFKNGNVVEQGTHDELIKKDGIYKEMYMLQADYYK